MSRLEGVTREYLQTKLEDEGLSVQFYLLFWRLSLQDIYTPSEAYDRTLAAVAESKKQLDMGKSRLERDRDYAHSREYKAQKKESARIADFHEKQLDMGKSRLER